MPSSVPDAGTLLMKNLFFLFVPIAKLKIFLNRVFVTIAAKK